METLLTVRNLLEYPTGDIHLMRGVGNQIRREIIDYVCKLRGRFPGVDAPSDYGSTVRQGPGILVDVHPGYLHRVDGRLATTTFAETSRMDNLLSTQI